MDQVHGMRISEPTAERIKMGVGAAMPDLKDASEDMEVVGPNKTTDLPLTASINYKEIAQCMEKNITSIETAILQALGQTPSELYADIVHNGIFLTGGRALLHGLPERLTQRMTIQFHVADAPLTFSGIRNRQSIEKPVKAEFPYQRSVKLKNDLKFSHNF